MDNVRNCKLRNIPVLTTCRISVDGNIGIHSRIYIFRCEHNWYMVGHCGLHWVLFPFCRTESIVVVLLNWWVCDRTRSYVRTCRSVAKIHCVGMVAVVDLEMNVWKVSAVIVVLRSVVIQNVGTLGMVSAEYYWTERINYAAPSGMIVLVYTLLLNWRN